VKEMKCAVRMPLAEWLSGWKMWHEREDGPDEQFSVFMKRNGASDDDAAAIMEAQRRSKYLGLRPPREFIRIRDGDVIAMGQREWLTITAGGHSSEHAMFYCESDKILIAGDQILSHMAPSVMVPSAQPEANPMKDYLDSLTRLEVLAPETLAAVRAAAANQLQTSMNLAFGSAMASIGLTIPAIAVASLFTALDLQLGLSGSEIVLMALTVVTTILTVLPGRVTVMQGAIHLSIFATFLFLAVSP